MTGIPGTSISGATGLSAGLGRANTADNLQRAGQQFEASFDAMMLKSMRQAKLTDPLFDSKAIDTFTEMGDAQVAQVMAQHQPIGIGKAVVAYLSKAQPSGNGSAATTPP